METRLIQGQHASEKGRTAACNSTYAAIEKDGKLSIRSNAIIALAAGTRATTPAMKPNSQENVIQGVWQEVKPPMPAPGTAQPSPTTSASGWTEVKHDLPEQGAPKTSAVPPAAALSQHPSSTGPSQAHESRS